jgi:hypothetical protein
VNLTTDMEHLGLNRQEAGVTLGRLLSGSGLMLPRGPTNPTKICVGSASNYDSIDCVAFGPTPLIAAMRCYVISKLGDEVEVPDELA